VVFVLGFNVFLRIFLGFFNGWWGRIWWKAGRWGKLRFAKFKKLERVFRIKGGFFE